MTFCRIQAEPAWGIDPDIYFGAVVEAGDLGELGFVSTEAAKQTADFIMGATAPEWKRVLRKETKVITELMLRKIVLEKGSMASALQLMPYAPAFIGSLTKVDLRFPDEMAPGARAAQGLREGVPVEAAGLAGTHPMPVVGDHTGDRMVVSVKGYLPLFSKISVVEKEKHPLYRYLTEQSAFPGRVTWNFQKYLVDRSGNVIGKYDPGMNPLSPAILADVERALAAS